MTRTLVHAAQDFHDVKLELTHPVWIFAVEYSAQLLNRAQRAVKDNRTAYELRKGRPYKRKLPPVCGGSDVSPGGGEEDEAEVRGQVEHRHLPGSC